VRTEALVFGRHLVGRTPPAELLDRYEQACLRLFPDRAPPDEEAVIAFARRHPWSVGCLDAASALLRPQGRLRGKLLVMAAILETSPVFADEFLPRSASLPGLVSRVALHGIRAVVEVALGIPLRALVAWRRSEA
jgi:hypothetical protein